MTLCDFCTQQFFHFDDWYRNEARAYHTDPLVWAASIKRCSICLVMVEAVKSAILAETGGGSIQFDPLLDAGIVHSVPLPLYNVYLHECVARDQWELDFKPTQAFNLRTSLADHRINLPIRTFKVFAQYYNSVAPRPGKIDVAEKFRLHRLKLQRAETAPAALGWTVPRRDRGNTFPTSSGITSSHEAFETCKSWLARCQNHAQCSTLGIGFAFAPTRLLKLGTEGDIRLIETHRDDKKQNPKYSKYATLSHCWGGMISCMLKQKRVEEYKKRIPLAELTRNFRDAVYTARKLGIKYLWIDSLCIIQDSDDDKAVQLPDMQQIYSCSYLNLAAANSRDSHQGFFRYRDLSLLFSTVRVDNTNCVVMRKDFWSGELLSEPLYKRGWVLQERTLSPRTLHFSRQCFWQCLENTACEIMPLGVPMVIESGREELKWRRTLHKIGEHSLQEQVDLQEAWRFLIKLYKGCQMSLTADRLAAIDGLATRYSQISGEQSIAGLWHGGLQALVVQLAWRATKPGHRYEHYIAPTWSWVSVDAVVELPPRVQVDHDYMLEVIGYDIKTKQQDSVEIVSAWLEVKGDIVRTELGTYHPDILQFDRDNSHVSARRTVLPLHYHHTEQGVSGWAVAIEKTGNTYQRIGLVEWRNIPDDAWEASMKDKDLSVMRLY